MTGARPMRLRFLPPDVLPETRLLLWGRALRAFGDGLVSLLLPFYLTLLGFDPLAIGVLTAATLAGSAALTLGVGFTPHRFGQRRLLGAPTLRIIPAGTGLTPEARLLPL